MRSIVAEVKAISISEYCKSNPFSVCCRRGWRWDETGETGAALLQAGRAMGRAFTVRELHDAAAKDQPKLGLTTAYRAVERWREEGFAEEAGQPRRTRPPSCFCTVVESPPPCRLRRLRRDRHARAAARVEPVRDAVSDAGFELIDEALGALPARCADVRCHMPDSAPTVLRRCGTWQSTWPAAPGARATSRWRCRRASWSDWWGRTAPARPRCCGRSRACCPAAAGSIEAPATIGYMPQLGPGGVGLPAGRARRRPAGRLPPGGLAAAAVAQRAARPRARPRSTPSGMGALGRRQIGAALGRPAPAGAACPHAGAGRRSGAAGRAA